MDKFHKKDATETGARSNMDSGHPASIIRDLYALVFKYFPDIDENSITPIEQTDRNGGSRYPVFHQIWSDWTVSQVYELLAFAREHLKNDGHVYPVELHDLEKYSKSDILIAIKSLKDLQVSVEQIHGYDTRIWNGFYSDHLNLEVIKQIRSYLEAMLQSVSTLQRELLWMHTVIPQCVPKTLNQVQDWNVFLRLVVDSPPSPQPTLSHQAWAEGAKDVYLLIDKVAAFHLQFPDLEERFHRRALTRNIRDLYDRVLYQKREMFKIFDKNPDRVKHKLAYIFRGEVPAKRKEILAELERLLPVWSLYNEIEWSKGFGIELFGSLWEGADSDVMALRMATDWAIKMLNFKREPFSSLDIKDLRTKISIADLREHIINLEEARKKISRDIDRLKDFFSMDKNGSWMDNIVDVPLNQLKVDLENRLDRVSELPQWNRFTKQKNVCNQTMAKPFIDAFENGSISPKDLVANFILNLTRATFGGENNG